MIITCPSCKTEYSVENSLLQGVEEPRFHCAICNHYFDLDARKASRLNNSLEISNGNIMSAAEATSPETNNSIAAISSSKSSWQERFSAVLQQPQTSAKKRTHEKLPQTNKQLSLFADTENSPYDQNAVRAAAWPQEEFAEGSASLNNITKQSPKLDSIALPNRETPVVDFAPRNSTRPSWFRRFESNYIRSQQPAKTTTGKAASYLKVFLILSLPLIMVGMMSYWGIHYQEIPGFIKGLLALKSTKQIPPVELELVNVVSDYVTLDDGKQIVVVSGKVFNATAVTFKDVQIESAVFDKNNRLLVKLVVPLFNSLSTAAGGPAKLNSLKMDLIRALQEKPVTDQELKPAHYVPFRVVFTAQIDNASYFSTRVFSVRNN